MLLDHFKSSLSQKIYSIFVFLFITFHLFADIVEKKLNTGNTKNTNIKNNCSGWDTEISKIRECIKTGKLYNPK